MEQQRQRLKEESEKRELEEQRLRIEQEDRRKKN